MRRCRRSRPRPSGCSAASHGPRRTLCGRRRLGGLTRARLVSARRVLTRRILTRRILTRSVLARGSVTPVRRGGARGAGRALRARRGRWPARGLRRSPDEGDRMDDRRDPRRPDDQRPPPKRLAPIHYAAVRKDEVATIPMLGLRETVLATSIPVTLPAGLRLANRSARDAGRRRALPLPPRVAQPGNVGVAGRQDAPRGATEEASTPLRSPAPRERSSLLVIRVNRTLLFHSRR